MNSMAIEMDTSVYTPPRKFTEDKQFDKTVEMRRQRVLVVEDDMELTGPIDRAIRSISPLVNIEWVTSTEAAISRIENGISTRNGKPYDLVLADIFLEGSLTGVDLWRICQSCLPEVPVVLMSGLPVDRFFNTLGENVISPPYLSKPFKVGECKQLLQGILNYSKQEE